MRCMACNFLVRYPHPGEFDFCRECRAIVDRAVIDEYPDCFDVEWIPAPRDGLTPPLKVEYE